MNALSWEARSGRTGVGLVDLLRAAIPAWASESNLFARGLCSKASMIREAVFIDELNVGVREAGAGRGGAVGAFGSEGSGNVLERFRPRSRAGGGVDLEVVGNALGGEVGVRFGCRGLWAAGLVVRTSNVGDGAGGLLGFSSGVGDGAVRLGVSNVGEASPLFEMADLLFSFGEEGRSGKGASSRDFEFARVCKVGVERAGAEEEDTMGGLARALLAAVGSVRRELLAKGIVGLLLSDETGGTGGGAFDATNGVFALLDGALFVGEIAAPSGRGGSGWVGMAFCSGSVPLFPKKDVLLLAMTGMGSDADGLWRDEEKSEKGLDFLEGVV